MFIFLILFNIKSNRRKYRRAPKPFFICAAECYVQFWYPFHAIFHISLSLFQDGRIWPGCETHSSSSSRVNGKWQKFCFTREKCVIYVSIQWFVLSSCRERAMKMEILQHLQSSKSFSIFPGSNNILKICVFSWVSSQNSFQSYLDVRN